MKIHQLPDEVRQRSKANTEEWYSHTGRKENSSPNELPMSFNYSRTPEGEDYWRYWEKQELPPELNK